MTRVQIVVVSGILVTATGCASVPPAAPQLSANLGGRIQEMHASHIQAVRLYFNAKRAEVDRFVNDEWLPLFAKEVLEQPAIASKIEQLHTGTPPAERVAIIVGLGTRLQAKINAKRLELMRPVEEYELAVVRKLEESYNTTQAINSTLTGLLSATADATKTQQDILSALQAQGPLDGALAGSEKLVGLLTDGRNAYEKNKPAIDAILNAVQR
jgi:hypothetical protein